MYQIDLAKFTAALVLVAGLLWGVPASAHINMTGALMSRGGDEKMFPCDGKRGDGPVYMFEPGATITLSIAEAIPHPSYFRIAFDNDGDDAFIEPKSIKPIESDRACPYDANDKCGEPDYCNVTSSTGGPTVLWDNLDPHSAGALNAPYTWNVRLPDVECENCTIQVLQIMEDVLHGAYCPTGSCTDNSAEDIYHRCIDITLKKGATNSPGTTTAAVSNKGVDCVQMAQPPAGGSGAAMGGTGGSAGTSGMAGSTGGTGATAGAGGNAAGGTAGAGSAGTIATSAGSAAPSTGAAGTKAPSVAGSTGSAGTGTTQGAAMTGSVAGGAGGPIAAAGSGASSAPPSSSDGGGCAVAMLRRSENANAGWFLLVVSVTLFRRRRRTAKPAC
jgi:hypothetical protein